MSLLRKELLQSLYHRNFVFSTKGVIAKIIFFGAFDHLLYIIMVVFSDDTDP